MLLAVQSTGCLGINQFGGRQGYSVPEAVLKLVHDAKTCNRTTSAIMVDIKGAFDRVHRDTLIDTLESMSLRTAAISWVHHFLTERYTSLVVDGSESRSSPVQTGIPQGSPISHFSSCFILLPCIRSSKTMGVSALDMLMTSLSISKEV
jgi:hypothetical protein